MAEKIKKTLAFDRKVLEKAEELAAQDNRSLNNWLEWLMMKAIEQSKNKK